jgi:hypothetical protein
MKKAKDDLRDITVDRETRIQHANIASLVGQELALGMSKTLRELQNHIERLEDLRASGVQREGSVPSPEQQEANKDALMAWASCLPETAGQVRAGRQEKYILKALVEPCEERKVLTITDLSSMFDRGCPKSR